MNAQTQIERPMTAKRILAIIARQSWAASHADKRCTEAHNVGDRKSENLWSDSMAVIDRRIEEQRDELRDMIVETLGVTFDQLAEAGL